MLRHYYETEYFFSSNAYRNSRTKFFELEKVYRQDDKCFLGVLNHIRTGTFDLVDMGILNERVMRAAPEDCAICIYPFNAMADGLNSTKYDEINEKEYVFEGEINGDFVVDKMANVEKTIKLKVGARVMTMVNQYSEEGNFIYYNGSIGTITAIDPQLRWISVKMTDSDRDVTVWRNVWKNVQQIYDEENDRIIEIEIGSFTQIPVRLAWAITIHKCQGLTFNSVQVNVNGAFASGQTYVALSRCRGLSGLHLEQPVGLGSIIVDQRVVSFYNIVHAEFTRVFNEVSEIDELYDEAFKNIKERKAAELIDNICKARKINNYITKQQHAEFIKKVSRFIDEYWHNRALAVKAEEAQLRCQTLQKELDSANSYIQEIEADNTQLLAKYETQTKHIVELEAENSTNLQTITKQSAELQELKQLFIEKTIELDKLKKDPRFKRLFKIGW